jgi:hypothetical protein
MLAQALLALLILAAMVAAAVRFHHMQNRPPEQGCWTGGPISWPKSFWLVYALGAWFFLPWVFAFAPGIDCWLRAVLLIHVTIWWFRGALEGFMIYRWFNWSPAYGISHDGFHLLFLFIGTAWAAGHVGWSRLVANPADLQAFVFLATTQFAITAEAVFAALFIATRGTGADKTKIYFASDEPVFRLINSFTRSVCIIVYSALAVQIVWMAVSKGTP